MTREKGFMSWEIFKSVIDQCRGYTRTMYLHQIGEPLLHKELIQFINYASEAGIRTSISTNCLLLDEDMTRKILGSKLSEITLCLDSLNKEIYEKIRIGSDYEKVIKNITYFLLEKNRLKSKVHAQLQMIKMELNKSEWDKYGTMLFQADEILKKNYSTFAGNVGRNEKINGNFRCDKTTHCLTFQQNGDIVICCRDFNGVTKIGNVLQDKISTVWANHKGRNCGTIKFCENCENFRP
jgi:uncharacterized radical SAM superfamily Fe-S cluster-containing enzyme